MTEVNWLDHEQTYLIFQLAIFEMVETIRRDLGAIQNKSLYSDVQEAFDLSMSRSNSAFFIPRIRLFLLKAMKT